MNTDQLANPDSEEDKAKVGEGYIPNKRRKLNGDYVEGVEGIEGDTGDNLFDTKQPLESEELGWYDSQSWKEEGEFIRYNETNKHIWEDIKGIVMFQTICSKIQNRAKKLDIKDKLEGVFFRTSNWEDLKFKFYTDQEKKNFSRRSEPWSTYIPFQEGYSFGGGPNAFYMLGLNSLVKQVEESSKRKVKSIRIRIGSDAQADSSWHLDSGCRCVMVVPLPVSDSSNIDANRLFHIMELIGGTQYIYKEDNEKNKFTGSVNVPLFTMIENWNKNGCVLHQSPTWEAVQSICEQRGFTKEDYLNALEHRIFVIFELTTDDDIEKIKAYYPKVLNEL